MVFNELTKRLWEDEFGAVASVETLSLATLLGAGVVVGAGAMRDAVNSEMTELANSTLALSQSYHFHGVYGNCAWTDGSEAIDHACLMPVHESVPPEDPSEIDTPPSM